jgi:hypothetical protein
VAGAAGCPQVSGTPDSHPGTAAAEPSGVSAASSAVRPQRRGGHAGRTPTTPQVRPAGTSSWGTRAPARPPGCRTQSRTLPPQRRRCRWPWCGTGSDTDRRCGTGRGHLLSAERPAGMTVEAAQGPQRFRRGEQTTLRAGPGFESPYSPPLQSPTPLLFPAGQARPGGRCFHNVRRSRSGRPA